MITTTNKAPAGWLAGRGDHIPSMRCGSSQSEPVSEQDVKDARERLRLTSLAYTDQMVTEKRPEKCPRASDRVVVELVSGQVYPDRCRANTCAYCLPLNARRRCLAITLMRPVRMIRLSLVADRGDENPCRTALIRIKRTRQALKRMGIPPGEWCYTIEQNPLETGFHVHCLQTGRSIDQDLLQTACERGGAGIPDIRSIRRTGIWTSRYGLKGFGADGYGLKTFRPSGDAAEALRINNGAVEHHTTGFFSFEGETLKVREVERLAIAQMNGEDPKAYVGMRGIHVQRVLADPGERHRLIVMANKRMSDSLRAVGYGPPQSARKHVGPESRRKTDG